MSEAGEVVPCVSCGAATPRREMFGLAPDLRCTPCAEALRLRSHPASVRRLPTAFRPTSARPDGRVAIGLVAFLVALWVGWQVESVQTLLVRWFYVPHAVFHPGDLRWSLHPYPWQFLAWPFLHAEIWHVAMNGWWYYQMGRHLEWAWGGGILIALTVGGGAAGSAGAWLIQGSPTIGASGGAFAMIGWLLAMRHHHVFAAAMVNRAFVNSLAANLVLMIVLTEAGSMRISHVGHGGGLAWGFAAGLAARSRRPLPGWALLVAATVVLLLLPSYVEPLGWRMTLFGRRG